MFNDCPLCGKNLEFRKESYSDSYQLFCNTPSNRDLGQGHYFLNIYEGIIKSEAILYKDIVIHVNADSHTSLIYLKKDKASKYPSVTIYFTGSAITANVKRIILPLSRFKCYSDYTDYTKIGKYKSLL